LTFRRAAVEGRARRPVAQHEASGGGRSIPQHQRVSARASWVDTTSRVDQHTAGPMRRTRIRRTRNEIAAVGTQLAAEALDMASEPAIYPSPAAHCSVCESSPRPAWRCSQEPIPSRCWLRTFGRGR